MSPAGPGPARARVLVTDGGDGQNRSALAAVRALAAAGHAPVVTVSGPRSLAAASRWCAAAVPVPPVSQPAAYRDAVRRLEAEHDVVLPASDAALVALDRPGRALVDKVELRRRAAAAGVPVPEEQVVPGWSALLEAADDLPYPVVLKPAVRDSPRQPPVRRAESAAHLRGLTPSEGPVVVQPYVRAPVSAVSGVVWDGRLVAVCHQRYLRLWPVETGVASYAETVDGDRALEERLPAVLAGHDGVFQAQLVGPYLVDLNPRVYGSLPLAVAAGADLPAVAVALALGRDVAPVRARPGVRYRWLEGDLRALKAARARGDVSARELVSALLPRPGTAHSTESLRDPRPVLTRLRHAARRRPPAA